ncbi:class I lanthipeptide [Rhodocytophaga aerolata]|uniref:Class I lanthipeptide n=1 Tax=Rhodocytophaga aerolata TaxID=455078 RepID=A0ABT8RC75_9BACT|nr:class I lanthipeptide [Rhodocytophaga aerolata]MDO1448783.1 class I lanthipeptide [Rhodocytophaga aerolata]
MKKQIKKVALKTEKIVSLSTAQAQNVQGGRMHKPFVLTM